MSTKNKKVLITGGCGYVGTKLIDFLVHDYDKIINIDTQWFGNYLKESNNLVNIKGDIRNINDFESLFEGVEVVIHLANIANDPSVDLDQTLSWEVNVLSAYKLAELCLNKGVKKIIYASSGSVYGVKNEKDVTEDLSLEPISTYNKTKMVAERVLMSFNKNIIVNCIRPATVCGLSPRMRFDVAVNMLTYQSIVNKELTVFGGEQVRPNIHIDDLINVYKFFLESDFESGYYNAGFENNSILELAKAISNVNESSIKILESNDPRSYRLSSNKILNLGFKPQKKISDAILEVSGAIRNNKNIVHPSCFTVDWMKKNNFK